MFIWVSWRGNLIRVMVPANYGVWFFYCICGLIVECNLSTSLYWPTNLIQIVVAASVIAATAGDALATNTDTNSNSDAADQGFATIDTQTGMSTRNYDVFSMNQFSVYFSCFVLVGEILFAGNVM